MSEPAGPRRHWRPNRSAVERRAQQRRADGRAAQRLLAALEALSTHRGGEPTRLGAVLATALRDRPRGDGRREGHRGQEYAGGEDHGPRAPAAPSLRFAETPSEKRFATEEPPPCPVRLRVAEAQPATPATPPPPEVHLHEGPVPAQPVAGQVLQQGPSSSLHVSMVAPRCHSSASFSAAPIIFPPGPLRPTQCLVVLATWRCLAVLAVPFEQSLAHVLHRQGLDSRRRKLSKTQRLFQCPLPPPQPRILCYSAA